MSYDTNIIYFPDFVIDNLRFSHLILNNSHQHLVQIIIVLDIWNIFFKQFFYG